MSGSEFKSRLGTAIAVRRKARGLTQEQFAEALGMSSEWVSRVERGVGLPPLPVLVKIATALETSASEIVAAVESAPAGRASVQRLDALARELPDDAVDVLCDAARSMRERWPGVRPR